MPLRFKQLYPIRVAERGLFEIKNKLGTAPDIEAHVAEVDARVRRENGKRPGTGHVYRDDLRVFAVKAHREINAKV